MNSIKIKNISWLGCRTAHFEAMVKFLKDTLGLKEVVIQIDMAEFRLESGDIFEIFRDPSSYNPHFTQAPVAEFLVDDVAETQAAMEAAGIKFLTSPRFAGSYSWSHFVAPDGNIYGLASGDYTPLQEMFSEVKEHYLVSTDKTKLDIEIICEFLSTSYWARNRPKDIILKSIENSMCFGVYDLQTNETLKANQSQVKSSTNQVGFARVITDFATFAYIADVFIVDAHRGKGLSKWLMDCIMNHHSLQGLRRWVLATKDAHGLYARSGFTDLLHPERWMEKFDLSA